MTSKKISNAIKAAHDKGAVLFISNKYEKSHQAKRFAKQMGFITNAGYTGKNTRYSYSSEPERLVLEGFTPKKINVSKEKTENYPTSPLNVVTKHKINTIIDKAYRDKAEFTLVLPRAKSKKEALIELRPFLSKGQAPKIDRSGKYPILKLNDPSKQLLVNIAIEE